MAYIYLIGNDEKQKIGVAGNPHTRLKQLQTGNPDELKLHHYCEVPDAVKFKLEKKIHHELGYLKIRGEWFKITPEFGINFIEFSAMTWIDPLLIGYTS